MEVGGEGDYVTIATLSPPTLRWAVMRAILMFHCEGQSHKQDKCLQTTIFEEKGEPKRI